MATIVSATTAHFAWLDLLYLLSYIKLAISLLKLLPQVRFVLSLVLPSTLPFGSLTQLHQAWLNYQRKSTIGWSIENVLLDISGGVLSL